MCRAARHRFTTKAGLIEWARKERDRRWLVLISFMSEENVMSESTYYKEQNIEYMYNSMKKNFRDVLAVVTLNAKINPQQVLRLKQATEEMEKLDRWASKNRAMVESCCSESDKKPGWKEQSSFWNKCAIMANPLCKKIGDLIQKLKSAVDNAPETADPQAKAKKRGIVKERRKEVKRKAGRSQLGQPLTKKKCMCKVLTLDDLFKAKSKRHCAVSQFVLLKSQISFRYTSA